MTRMRTGRSRGHSEGGAILIQVAIGLLVLTGFAMFAVDYGLMWVGRRQAQNAADAGALAGAVAMAFDGADRTNTGPAKTSAYKTAVANVVLGQSPGLNNPATEAEGSSTDVQFYPDNPSRFPSICADNSCVRVDVYRNQETGHTNNSVLPVWFGGLVGVQSQGTKAMAVARSAPANGTQCLKPWAVADKWVEGPTLDSDGDGFVWRQSNYYNPADQDSYTPPSATSPGTGFSNKDATGAPRDWGYQMTLKLANPSNGNGGTFVMSSGWAMRLDMPNAGNPDYENNISGCTSATIGISPPGGTCPTSGTQGQWTEALYESGCIPVLTGAGVGQDQHGLDDLIPLDSTAHWDRTLNNGRGGVVSTQSFSKRIVPVAVFDTAAYMQGVASNAFNGSNGVVRVVNILGFFIEGTCNDNTFVHESYLQCTQNGNERDIIGRLVSYPAINIPGGANIGNAAFGQVITLIR